jgi:hypothetical protein
MVAAAIVNGDTNRYEGQASQHSILNTEPTVDEEAATN